MRLKEKFRKLQDKGIEKENREEENDEDDEDEADENFSIPTKEPEKDYNLTQSQHQLNNQPAKAGNAPPGSPAQA